MGGPKCLGPAQKPARPLIFWLGSRLKTKMARERGENTSEISPTETLKKC